MSMETEDFNALRKLLALKRHEQPPPGYFDKFPREVMLRLMTGPLKRHWLVELSEEASWLRRLWLTWERKPLLAGAFGVAICGLMLSGFMYSQRMEPQQVADQPGYGSLMLPPNTPGSLALNQPAQVVAPASSTDPLIDTAFPGSLFDKLPTPQAQLANWPRGN